MTTDELLLHRYAKAGDPAAFRELVDRYAGLVYGISLRVTGDRHAAEDVCQDCFLELARKARMVRENVAGWLHAVATSRSLNVVRSRQRRTRREQTVATDAVAAAESPESRELQSLVDRALNGLSDDLRLPIILHYLQGQSQQQVAQRLGINQATVSRRLQRGVEQLRRRIRSFGVMTTVAALTSLFGQSAAQAASASLTGTLAKIGLGGVGVTIAKAAPGGLTAFLPALGVVAGNVLLFLFIEGWVMLLVVLIEFALLMRPPTWLRELLRARAFGRDAVAHPMWPWRRWTWTIPPADWKPQLVTWTLAGFMFGLMAFGNPAGTVSSPFFAAFALLTAMFLSLAARLAWRVWAHRENLGQVDARSREAHLWSSWEDIGGIAVCALVAATCLLSIPHSERFIRSPGTVSVWILFGVCVGALAWALIDRWRHRNRSGALRDDLPETDHVETKPVALRYHVVLIGCLAMMVVGFMWSAIAQSWILPPRPAPRQLDVYRYTKAGTRVSVERPMALKPPARSKGLPPKSITQAGAGLLFAVLLLYRVVKTRDQLPRLAWLGLLAFSVLAVSTSAGLMARGAWVARTVLGERAPRFTDIPQQQRKPTFQPSPQQRELVRKYATQAAVITVPDEQLPGSWYLIRSDNGFAYPHPIEGGHRNVAIEIGLPDVPELDCVVAHLTRIYVNPFLPSEVDSTCVVFAFCCKSEADARRLNHAWHNRGLCTGRLVIVVYGRKGLRAPSSSDQPPIPALLEHIRKTAPASHSH